MQEKTDNTKQHNVGTEGFVQKSLTMRIVISLILLVSVSLMAACQSLGYYAQSARGQFQVLNKSSPIDNWLRKKDADKKLKEKLHWIQQVREFASEELKLPKNKSYTEYADLNRNYVVWNIFAAPRLSLKPHRWCYPIVGCQAYRGYFSRQAAVDFAQGLQNQGFDVSVGGVRAYSTLGWFNDPVLNTFINYPKNDLAGLIFHELAHQQVYIDGDTVFNESFATLVEIKGVEKWLVKNATPQELQDYRQTQAFENAVTRLILRHKKALEHLYASRLPDAVKIEQKDRIFSSMKREYKKMKENSAMTKSAWDRWFAMDLNNANMVAVGSYYDKVDDFEKLFNSVGADFEAYYTEVKKLAKLPRSQRDDYFAKLDSAQIRQHNQPVASTSD